MGWLGKVLAAPVRLVNAPMRAAEIAVEMATEEESAPGDRLLSGPLEAVAKAVEEVVGDD